MPTEQGTTGKQTRATPRMTIRIEAAVVYHLPELEPPLTESYVLKLRVSLYLFWLSGGQSFMAPVQVRVSQRARRQTFHLGVARRPEA
jgi:hypothetical protein